MRILLVVTGFPSKDNPSRSVFNLVAANLLSRKHTITILRIRAWKPGRKFFKRDTFNEIPILYLSTPLFTNRFFDCIDLNYLFLQKIIKIFSKHTSKIDVIHSVGGGLNSYASSIISKKNNIPFITQYIGNDINFFITKNYKKKSIKKYINAASYHVFNSNQLMAVFSSMFNDIKKMRVVYRGIDLKNIEDVAINYPYDLKFLYLGGLVSGDYGDPHDNLKGGVTLINAWKKLDSTIDLTSAKLFFGGPNSKNAIKYISDSKINYPDSFKIIGEISKSEVKKHLIDANVVIIPSLFEGTPNVLFEAMAYKNMIVGTKIGGIPEIVDEKFGILVEPNNENEIVAAIKKIISKPEIIIKSANEAKQNIKKYDNTNFLKSYSEIYEEVKTSFVSID